MARAVLPVPEEQEEEEAEASRRPWSRHSKGSSAYRRTHPEDEQQQQQQQQGKSVSMSAPSVAAAAQDPGLAEFLGVMQPRSKTKLWANDADNLHNSNKISQHQQQQDWSDDEGDSDEDEHTAANDKTAAEPVLGFEDRKADEAEECSGRLFVRNLAYTTSEGDLSELFGRYGDLVEVHLVLDKETNRSKGFGYVLFMLPDAAARAMKELDKSTFQGRLLHVIPAKRPPSEHHQEKTVTPANLKQTREAERKKVEASGNRQAWNSLYMRPDTVAENVAKLHGVSKREFLDPEADDLAVRLALGETHVVSETKRSLSEQGVNVELLEDIVSSKASKVSRSSHVILVKNLPFSTTEADLMSLFGGYGSIGRLILPPSNTIAVVEFLEAFEARKAFESLAYRKYKHVPLYLEWAPEKLLTDASTVKTDKTVAIQNQLLAPDDADSSKSRCVFVKNLKFSTTEAGLKKHFEGKMDSGSLVKVTIKTKPSKDGKKPLSMGFGFLELDSVATAKRVCKEMQGSVLDGHSLVLELSHGDKVTTKKAVQGTCTKIIVRNVAFEATRKDLKQLFSPLGQMKRLKLPKKFDGSHRGFAFVEFVTRQEAQNAFEALANTHLYGRHLVLEWAKEEETLEDLRAKTALQTTRKRKLS